MNIVRIDGRGIFNWPIGQDNCPLDENQVVRLPYRTSRSGRTTWEIVLPRKGEKVERHANIHRLLREAAYDALLTGTGYYIRRDEVTPEEAELVFPWEVEETTTITNWRTLWYAYALAYARVRNRFEISPQMVERLLTKREARAYSRRHFVTSELEHLVRRRDGTWLLLFK